MTSNAQKIGMLKKLRSLGASTSHEEASAMTRIALAPAPSSYAWSVTVRLLLLLATVGPLIFGLPVLSNLGAADANFNLQLVQSYLRSLHAGILFPRWMPDGNEGFGSPVFYFYGRLPFMVAAFLSVILHVSAATGLLLGIAAFRLLAFFTCRAWLRGHSDTRSADCGALVFLTVPFAMLLNTIGRVGYAETAATAILPLLFLAIDQQERSWAAAARSAGSLALIYALLASIHLPQALLGFCILTLYALFLRGLRGLLANVVGAVSGVLLAGSSVLPAVLMQRFITPAGWSGDRYLDIHNNFLFTYARYHVYSLFAQDCYLYLSWFLCLAVCVLAIVNRRRRRGLEEQNTHLLVGLVILCLLSMTELSAPLWIGTPLRAVQFPWRIFPETIAILSLLVTRLASGSQRRHRVALACVATLVLVQMAVPALGVFVSRSSSSYARRIPLKLRLRAPSYAPASMRETPAYETLRAFPPEYIPAYAHNAGWHVSEDQWSLVPGAHSTVEATVPPPTLIESNSAGGDILLHGTLASSTTLLLPTFFFPDEELKGGTHGTLSLDQATGLTRLRLPVGPVDLQVSHALTLPSVRLGDFASVLGAMLVLLLFSLSYLARRQPVARVT